MADNVAITAGSGTTIHADEYTHTTLGAGKTQLMKLVDGTLDSSTPVATGSGTSTNAMRVELPTNGTGVIATVGAVTAITNALPAGTNAIGKLSANSGVDIGDVDVTSCALPTGASTSAKQDTTNSSLSSIDGKLPALGQALAAASVPVVLTAAQITTLTPPAAITGFATSAKQDLLLTELQLKADLTETQPVSLASVPSHAVTNAGTFAVQVTSAPSTTVTATDLDIRNLTNTDVVTAELSAVDNAVLDSIAASLAGTLTVTGGGGGTEYTEDAAAAANPVGNVLMLVREDARAGSLTTTDGDNIAARGNNKGELYVKTTDSDALLTTIDTDTSNISTKIDTLTAKDFATQTTLAAINTKLASGTVIGDVNLGATDNAVLDSIATNTGNALTDTQLRATAVPVSIATAPVLVAGTALIGKVGIDQVTANANEVVTKTGSVTAATLSAETTKVIGTVNIAAAQTLATVTTVGAVTAITNALPAGTNAIGKLSANSGVDIGDATINNAVTEYVYTRESQDGVVSEYVTNTDGAATALSVFTNTTSTYNYITSIAVYNSSATAGFVIFTDGNGGTTKWFMPLPAGGGSVISSNRPIFKSTANTAIYFDVSGALSTVYIAVSGYRSTI